MRVPSLPSAMSQPFCVILVHDKATDVPAFAFSNYGIGQLDTDNVKLDGYTIPLVLQVDDIQYKESRPSSLGIGLHRRDVTFTVRNSGPFTTAPFAAGLYSAGVNTDAFYFSVWITDFTLSIQNLRDTAVFLGHFDLDAGVGWDESSLTTNIKLIDRLTNLTGRYTNNTETAEELLQGSEWQRLLEQPAYLGYKSGVPAYGRTRAAISGFDTYQDSVLAVVAGIVTSSVLSGTSIQLGKSPALSQFVGQSVKLKMGNGCIVQGVITDLTGGEYGLDTTGLSLNLAWDTIECHNRGWTAVGNHLTSGEGGADLSSIFLEGGYTAPSNIDSALLGTASSSAGGSASAINDNSTLSKLVITSSLPVWFKIDLGVGNEIVVGKLRLNTHIDTDSSFQNFQLQGSNDDSAWDVIYTGTSASALDNKDSYYTFTPPTSTAYRFYRIYVTSRAVGTTKTGLYVLGLFEVSPVPGSTSLDKLPSPYMYVKTNGPVELYSGGVVTTAGPLFCKLTGVKDEANKELSCEPLKDPTNPFWKFGGITVEFDATGPSSNFSDADLLHLNYAKWTAKGTYGIYFTPNTYVLADIQTSGMPWELIATKYVNSGMTIENTYYIKLAGPTTILEATSGQYAIYGSDGQRLVLIPNSEIESITYDSGDFTLPDLCRIVFKRKLTEINESFDENLVYVDTYPPMHGAEVISYIMDTAGISASLRDKTLTTGTAELGNPMGVVIRDDTWTDLLDSVVFESGLQIDTMYGVYRARTSFNKSVPKTFNNTEDPTQTFYYVETDGVLAFADVIDGTYKMNIGKMYTTVDAGREFIRVHYTYDFVYSNFNGEKKRILQTTRAAKSNDRKIQYSFKHIVDTATATAAASQMQRMGHAANIPESMRVIEASFPLEYLAYQVLDTVYLNDFRHITRVDDPLPQYDDNSASNAIYTVGAHGRPYYKYTSDVPYALLPGVGIIDSISIDLSGNGLPVSIVFRQMQVNTTSNLKAVAERVEVLNTAAENTTDGATGPEESVGGYPGQSFRCPPGTVLQNTIIIPGEMKQSATTVFDPCCNSSTITGDVVSDPMVTIICAGDCQTFDGCHTDEWPSGCIDDSHIGYTPRTDSMIGNTEPLIFDIYNTSLEMGCPALVSIDYPGRGTPDVCVSFTALCNQFNEGNANFGLLVVNPCVFNTPAGSYSKHITLTFDVPYCYSDMAGWPYVKTIQKITRIKRTSISIPISLRPVSDINLG